MSIKSINLKDFKLKGYDPFYTRSVSYYIRKLGVFSVSSVEEIVTLKAQVQEAMLSDSLISNNIDKEKVINGYFLELIIAFVSLSKDMEVEYGKSDI